MAESILRDGFRDATGTYGTGTPHTGVWLSAEPLDENEGACGDALLAVDVPDAVFAAEVAPYEWVQDIGYREFLVPAELVNRVASITLESVDERPGPYSAP